MDERAARVAEMIQDPAVDLTVDANAVAGVLALVFGVDVTATLGQCAHCHTVDAVGTMRAYMRGPGVVLRCSSCTGVVIRIVERPDAVMVDLAGLAGLRLDR